MWFLIFGVLLVLVCGKLLVFALKAAWGITRIVCSIVMLPLVLIGLVAMGLIYVALPVLLIVGGILFFL